MGNRNDELLRKREKQVREINRVKDRQLVLPGTQKEALLLALSFLYPVPFLLLGFTD